MPWPQPPAGSEKMNTMEPELAVHHRGRIGLLLALGVLAGALALVAFVGLGSSTARSQSAHGSLPPLSAVSLAPPQLVVSAPRGHSSRWRVVASVGSTPAAWLSQRSGLTMMRFDQGLVHLDLHAGSSDGGSKGWTYGNRISSGEAKKLIAGFNGGFKLTYKETGFMANGHIARHLRTGLASIVTYADGSTNIGAWHQGIPSSASPVFSVLQNQRLLVDHGVPRVQRVLVRHRMLGRTIGLVTVVPRSALGITSSGQLVWAAGEHLSPAALADALIAAGAQRAVELDINPWLGRRLPLPASPAPEAGPARKGAARYRRLAVDPVLQGLHRDRRELATELHTVTTGPSPPRLR